MLRGDHFYYLLGRCTRPASSKESMHSPGKLVGVLRAESIVYPGLQEPPGDKWVRILSEKKNGRSGVKRVKSGHQDTKSKNRPLIHGKRLGGSPRTNEEWASHRELQVKSRKAVGQYMGLGQSPSTQTCLISVFCSVVVSGWVASKERDKPHSTLVSWLTTFSRWLLKRPDPVVELPKCFSMLSNL